jgi:hypothetical protein
LTPIQCSDQHINAAQTLLPCTLESFPCKYLGLPLSVRKLSKNDFFGLIDKIADKLPGWKASFLQPAGRAVLVKAVLTAVPIYHLIALQCPKWVIKAIDKIRRVFLWKGRKDIKSGHCLVRWERVCRPLDLGGLGIHNLEILGWALNMRWIWLKKTQPDRIWSDLDIKINTNVAAMLACSMVSLVGDDTQTCFWTDRWLHGQIHPGIPDQHCWTPTASGYYSKSAYDRFFGAAVLFEPAERIWRSWAPPKCKFFMWLASLNRCWTAGRLARRGLDHPAKCLLCDQGQEIILHILLQCVFAREVWHHILSLIGLQQVSPERDAAHFQDWWSKFELAVPKLQRKGFNSIVLLVAWRLWKHRNTCVFDGASPSISRIIEDIKEDARLWGLAGAAGLRILWP